MSYHKERKKAFRELSKKIISSKYPITESEVVKLAWNMQESVACYRGKRRFTHLCLEKVFYVYVLMDPRYSGRWEYVLPGGQKIVFPFLPFYVGKGTNGRMYDHIKFANKHKIPVRGKYKLNKIRKIHRLGLQVIVKRISDFSIESIAFAKEVLLIKTIGRLDKNTGPLTNRSGGGEGITDISESTREKLRRPKSEETKAKLRAANLGKSVTEAQLRGLACGWRPGEPRTPEHRAKISKALKGKSKTVEHCRNLSAALIGRKLSREACANMSASRLGKKRKPYKLKNELICSNCGYVGSDGPVMYKFHMNNCRISKDLASKVIQVLHAGNGVIKTSEICDTTQEIVKGIRNGLYWRKLLTDTEFQELRTNSARGYSLLTCSNCGYVGKGSNMYKYHFNKCAIKKVQAKRVHRLLKLNTAFAEIERVTQLSLYLIRKIQAGKLFPNLLGVKSV